MEIRIPHALLKKTVGFVMAAVESRNVLPILTHIYFEVKDGALIVLGSNLELELQYTLPIEQNGIEIDDVSESFTLPAKKLSDLLKATPDGGTAILKQDKANQYILRFTGLRSRYKLSALPGNDFPNLETSDSSGSRFEVATQDLMRSLSSVDYAMASGDVRYYLNGMQWSGKGNSLTVESTDGHRLAQNKCAFTHKEGPREFSGILPRQTALTLSGLLKDASDTLEASVASNHIFIHVNGDDGGRVIKSKLIDGRYPETQRVIPKQCAQNININRMDLLNACKRVAIIANEKFKGVEMNFGGSLLRLESRNPEQESGSEEVTIPPSEALEIGFNVDFLIAALGKFSTETVSLGLTDSTTSMLLTAGEGKKEEADMLAVVMPMRI